MPLGALVGETISKPDADFVRQATGFVIGGVPPVLDVQELRTFIDEDLLAFNEIWAAADTPHAVFKLRADALPGLTGGQVVKVK